MCHCEACCTLLPLLHCYQAAWAAREKELQEEHKALSTKLRLQADLSHKADQAAQAKVRYWHSLLVNTG